MKTAVEWLEGQLNIWQTIADEDTNATLDVVKGWIAKLKEMEKEQIIEAFKHGELPPIFVNYNAEEYYNETYKSE